MKIILAAVLSTILLFGVSVNDATANDDAAWFLGGVVGGLVLGEITEGPRYRPRNYDYYVYDEPVYEKRCVRRWVKRWDEYRQTWVKVKRTRCDWVRVY